MATPCSFDITSNVDLQEVDNALNQARKEVAQRYDFKGSKASIDFDAKESKLVLDRRRRVQAECALGDRADPPDSPQCAGQEPDARHRHARRQQHRAPGNHPAAGHPLREGQGHRQVPEGREAEEGASVHPGRPARVTSPSKTIFRKRCACCASRTSASRCSSATIAADCRRRLVSPRRFPPASPRSARATTRDDR